MNTRPWLCPLFGMKSRPRAIRCRPRPLLEALEARLAPAVLLSYGGPGTVLGLLEQASAATPAVSISEPAVGQLDIDLDTQTFDAMSTAAAPGLTYEIPGSPTTSHFADIAIGQANNVTALEATLPGDALTVGVIASVSGGLGDIAASAGLITVTGVDTSNAGAGEGNVDLKAAGALTVAGNSMLDTGTGTISLAADVNADGTGNSNSGDADDPCGRDGGVGQRQQQRHHAARRGRQHRHQRRSGRGRRPRRSWRDHAHRHPHRAECCPTPWRSTPAATSSSPTQSTAR